LNILSAYGYAIEVNINPENGLRLPNILQRVNNAKKKTKNQRDPIFNFDSHTKLLRVITYIVVFAYN